MFSTALKRSIALLYLLLVSCMPVSQSEQLKASVFASKVKAIPKELIGERIEVGLGKLLSHAALALKLGKQLDSTDKQMAGSLAYQSLEAIEDNRIATWENPNNGHIGKFAILKTQGVAEKDIVCRDFMHILIIDNKEECIYGQACREMWEPNSQWKLQG